MVVKFCGSHYNNSLMTVNMMVRVMVNILFLLILNLILLELKDFLVYCSAKGSVIGTKISFAFTEQSEFHVSTCLQKLVNPDHIKPNDLGTTLRVLIGGGKGKEKRRSFTVV